MTVSARGSYYGLLNVVADLDRAALPMRITLDTIANPRRDVVPDPELQATFHVTLFREADIRPETAHAPA
jgi:hypothetical protein